MSKVYLVSGKNQLPANEKLAEVMQAVFSANTAHANIAKRAELAVFVGSNLDKFPPFDSIVIESDEERITIKNENLASVLAGIVDAIGKNESFRDSVKLENSLYNSIREVVSLVEKETGKRGRKSESIESKYGDAIRF